MYYVLNNTVNIQRSAGSVQSKLFKKKTFFSQQILELFFKKPETVVAVYGKSIEEFFAWN
jgi:hypothetical protein